MSRAEIGKIALRPSPRYGRLSPGAGDRRR
jgi:hypothetical protein